MGKNLFSSNANGNVLWQSANPGSLKKDFFSISHFVFILSLRTGVERSEEKWQSTPDILKSKFIPKYLCLKVNFLGIRWCDDAG